MIELEVQYLESAADSQEEPPSREKFQQWADLAYTDKKPAQLNIRIVDESESQSTNKQYRNKDKATNVLSFPMSLPKDIVDQLDVVPLGDLLICAPVVESEAKKQNKTNIAHWAHMVIHGLLHLQGYDHISSADAEQMESLEIELLQQLDIDNPYQEIHDN